MPKYQYTKEQIARSFVLTILKEAKKELPLYAICSSAKAIIELCNPGENKTEACQPDTLKTAALTLTEWGKIVQMSSDTFCDPKYLPKYRTIDDNWVC